MHKNITKHKDKLCKFS